MKYILLIMLITLTSCERIEVRKVHNHTYVYYIVGFRECFMIHNPECECKKKGKDNETTTLNPGN